MKNRLLAPLGAAAALLVGPLTDAASACAWCREEVRTAVHQATFRADVLQMLLPAAALVVLALIVPSAIERWLDAGPHAANAAPQRLERWWRLRRARSAS